MYVYQRSPSIKINFDITFRDKDFFLGLFPTQIYATNSTLYKIFQEKKNKMKNEKKKKKKKYHTVGTVPISNRKIVEKGKIDTFNTNT